MAKKIPMRQCIGCGGMKSKKELFRILRNMDEEIILDATGKQNGRGAYICPNAECLKRAKKSKGLERSLKMHVPDEIYERITKEIELFEKSICNAGDGNESR